MNTENQNLPENQNRALSPVENMKNALDNPWVKDQFKSALGKASDLFTASILSAFSTDSNLQKCNPGDVIKQALKAAVLKLPIEKSLGYAYIIPYAGKPQFQMGYKGLIQLAQRSGQIKCMNDGPVYEGQTVVTDYLTGEVEITGKPKAKGKAVGYFAYFKQTNGYEKAEYWTVEEVIAHASKYSQSYKKKAKIWVDEFDKMASKTVLAHILGKYAPKSIDFLLADGDRTKHKGDGGENIQDEFETEIIETELEESPGEESQNESSEPEIIKPTW